MSVRTGIAGTVRTATSLDGTTCAMSRAGCTSAAPVQPYLRPSADANLLGTPSGRTEMVQAFSRCRSYAVRMSDNDEEIQRVEIIDDEVSEGLTRTVRVTARDLHPDEHIGKFIGCSEGGVNYQAKILDLRIIETGKAPGVTIKTRHPNLPHRAARNETSHLPFDYPIELIELTAI